MHKIVEGPTPLRGGTDFRAWRFVLQDEAGEYVDLEFQVTGSALSTAERCLPLRVAEARRTSGLSEIERLLSWPALPERLVAGTQWITLHHCNGCWSRVGMTVAEGISDPAARFRALVESTWIWVPVTGDAHFLFEFSRGAWSKKAVRGSTLLAGPERLLLVDVLSELRLDSQRQEALDIDPEGAAMLSSAALLARA
jgi:hypothetical protein